MKKLLYCLVVVLTLTLPSASAQKTVSAKLLREQGFTIVNIENEGVKKFLDDRSYDDPALTGKYSYSVIKNYSKGFGSTPAGLNIKWEYMSLPEDIADVEVTLSESADYKEKVKKYYPGTDTTQYVIRNMRPGHYYYYKVEELRRDGKRFLLDKGKFVTTGRVRMLRVDGMYNVRDLGGWATSFGVKTRYGHIFRGNRPDGITKTGKNDFVKNEHITADLDLRGNPLGESPFGQRSEVDYFCTNNYRYNSALTSHTDVLVADLHFIAGVLRKNGSVFLHCNHGANRAGTLAFLIDGLLGLNEADLSREYELSGFSFSSVYRGDRYGTMLPIIRSYALEGEELAQCFYNFWRSIGATEEDLDIVRCVMLGLKPRDARIQKAHEGFIPQISN